MALVHAFFHSYVLDSDVSCDVILPQKDNKDNGSQIDEKETIPVLWLLHGGGDDQTMWQRFTSIERYVKHLGFAVVMPYTEFAAYSNQVHGSGRYYDYIANELPEIMHDFFGLSLERQDNFIAGMSMGGNGALKIGMANPEKYSVIGCLSAGFFDHDVPDNTSNLNPETDRKKFMRYDGRDLVGSEEDMLENARKIIRENKPVPRVFHSIGDNDHILWIGHKTREFFESFDGNPFNYCYEEHQGRHNWDYWDVHIQRFLQFIVSRESNN